MEHDIQTEPAVPETEKPKTKAKLFGLATGVLALVLVVSGGVYFWQHDKVTKSNSQSNSLSNEIADLKQQLSKAEQASKDTKTTDVADTVPAVSSSDDQVLAAVKAYCNANVDPATKKPLVLKVGTAGQNQKQVLYSADKNFAYVNAVCSQDGTTDGSGAAYYLKHVNDSWVFLYRGQMSSPEYTKQFDIPAEFN